METDRLRAITLTDRDRAILEHVARYRITTSEAVQRLFFPEQQPDAVKSTLRRLREGGYLASAPLYQRSVYYHLTPKAAHTIGQPEHAAAPLGVQSRAAAFGVLSFCCLGPARRTLIPLDEFRRQYPQLIEPGLPSTQYYVDQDVGGKNRLGLIQVDYGADHRRIVRKCRRLVQRRLSLPAFRTLIRDDGFLIAIVTADPRQAAALEKAIAADRPLIKFRIEVFPEMEPVIQRRALCVRR